MASPGALDGWQIGLNYDFNKTTEHMTPKNYPPHEWRKN
jgi:hypothetical protein